MSYSAYGYVRDAIQRGARVKRERTPWVYREDDPRHARDAYRLLIFPSGFMQRIYDWEYRQ